MKWSHPMTSELVEAPDEPTARRRFRELLGRKRLAELPQPVYPAKPAPPAYDDPDGVVRSRR